MSEVALNLSDYKSSGVYFVEIDNSITKGSSNSAIRLAVGYNEVGPFNRPVYLGSTADCDELLGGIDRKLERRGCYTNRNLRTMVTKAPVYALNLMDIDTSDDVETNLDRVGFNAISFDANKSNIAGYATYASMYDRTKFWIADPSTMMDAIARRVDNGTGVNDNIHSPLYAFGNCGTKDISLIVRKAEGLTGYNVTFLDWYGKEDNIPYKWINPYDYVSDYFIQVIAIAGDFKEEDYPKYAADTVWGSYFSNEGLKKDKLYKFLRLDAVTVIGNWTGCIIPDFYDKQGKCKSIDYLINKNVVKTGLMFGINTAALDLLTLNKIPGENGVPGFYLDLDADYVNDGEAEAAPYSVDMVGVNLSHDSSTDTPAPIKFMSYEIPGNVVKDSVYTYPAKATGKWDGSTFVHEGNVCEFICNDTDQNSGTAKLPSVGDYVRAANGTLTRIIKKRAVTDPSVGVNYIYTTLSPVCAYSPQDVVSSYSVKDDMTIPNEGETNPENDGYQDYMVYGVSDSEEGEVTYADIAVEIHKSISTLYDTLKFIPLTGLKITSRHRPGFDASGNIDMEAGVEKIYGMLKDDGIKKGLLNRQVIDFAYIVDTMGGGLGDGCRGKKYLAELAQEKGSCTALINLPSMSDFAASTAPLFCADYDENEQPKPVFDISYIPEGGNQDHAYKAGYELFTLPTEEQGSKFCALFSPYLKYAEGARTILVPPAADVSNTFMNKHLGGDPYKTVANLNGLISNPQVVGLEYYFDTKDRDALEPFGVNPIITRGGLTMIYGDRTAYQTVNSDMNFLHVRELLNTIESRCRAILDDYIFTYNNANTRAEIYTRLEPILKSMKDSGALAKYEMQIDEINNPKEVIDAKACIVDIGVWVTPNMEKIVTRLTVNRGSEA